MCDMYANRHLDSLKDTDFKLFGNKFRFTGAPSICTKDTSLKEGDSSKENDIYSNIYVYVLEVHIYMSETTKIYK